MKILNKINRKDKKIYIVLGAVLIVVITVAVILLWRAKNEGKEYCTSYWIMNSEGSCEENEDCMPSKDLYVLHTGIITFKTLSACENYLSENHWQIENDECVLVNNIEEATERWLTEGFQIFDTLSTCQKVLNED